MNKAYSLSRRPYFVPHAIFPLFLDGEVPSYADLQRKPEQLFNDAQLELVSANVSRLSHEFADLIREGYSQANFNGDEGEWTKDSRIGA
jgi:hypothetical protein